MNFSQNFYRLWIVLTVIAVGISLWFAGLAATSVWKYIRLNERAPANIFDWQIQEISSSRYALQAQYQFEVEGASYNGKTIFEKPQFLNRFAAENYVAVKSSKRWETWYSKSDPTYNSLEREFPRKKCLHAFLTIGVFLYFFFARSVVMRMSGLTDPSQ